MIRDGVRTKISCRQPTTEVICLESRFHSNSKTLDFCRINNISKIVKYGSSIKLCKISEGVADVYPRYEPTKEWDTAAAHCILTEAGGSVIDLVTKEELKYNKSTLVNNFFIASSNKKQFIYDF
jgi:3'(2'), 5'-bisphosphate nucleotidase